MNITIDEAPTLEALTAAHTSFLEFARQANESALPAEDKAIVVRYWTEQAHWIEILRTQITSRGKVPTSGGKPN